MIGGIILGLINYFVKPLMKLVSIPFTILTGGLFLIVINIALLWIFKYVIDVWEFRDVTLTFPNWETYVIGAVVFGVINYVIHLIFK